MDLSMRSAQRRLSEIIGNPKAWRHTLVPVSLAEVLDDLLTLQELASSENDPARRRSLEDVRTHLARRDRGAKVSEAAEVLGLSQPTVRAWIESGVLTAVSGARPTRVGVLALVETKRALDLIREQADDR